MYTLLIKFKMERGSQIVAKSLLFFFVVALTELAVEAKHWPDFSCHKFKVSQRQQRYVKHHNMGWNSCEDSFQRTKQECDKMCALRSRQVVLRSEKDGPFNFHVDAFITLMLMELGYSGEYKAEAPEQLVNQVRADLELCKANHREYETMKNFNNLPCEPYNDLFECIDKAVAVGCPVDKSGNQ